jgi:hypothetical protein
VAGIFPDETELTDFAELCGTGPERGPREVMTDAMELMGERPAGYQEMRRMQYRGAAPDTSELRERMGLS